jgi:hypothetical protein
VGSAHHPSAFRRVATIAGSRGLGTDAQRWSHGTRFHPQKSPFSRGAATECSRGVSTRGKRTPSKNFTLSLWERAGVRVPCRSAAPFDSPARLPGYEFPKRFSSAAKRQPKVQRLFRNSHKSVFSNSSRFISRASCQLFFLPQKLGLDLESS